MLPGTAALQTILSEGIFEMPGQSNPSPYRPDSAFGIDLPSRSFRRRRLRSEKPVVQPDTLEMSSRLQQFDIFSKLPAQDLSHLASAASIKVFQAGEYIWREGQQHNQVLFIENGLAKASRVHGDGVKRTYGLYGPRDTMGIYAIWAGMRYPTDAIAMNDGMTAILLDSSSLIDLVAQDPRLAEPLMIELSRFTEAFLRKIDIVSAGTIAQRMAALMRMLIDRYGVEKLADSARLPIHLTLEQVSEIVDARIETVARVLSQWRKEGWLEADGRGYHFTSLETLEGLPRHA